MVRTPHFETGPGRGHSVVFSDLGFLQPSGKVGWRPLRVKLDEFGTRQPRFDEFYIAILLIANYVYY